MIGLRIVCETEATKQDLNRACIRRQWHDENQGKAVQ